MEQEGYEEWALVGRDALFLLLKNPEFKHHIESRDFSMVRVRLNPIVPFIQATAGKVDLGSIWNF
jgi:hypothetical protein